MPAAKRAKKATRAKKSTKAAAPAATKRILLVDDETLTLPDHDLAILGATFDTALNLHGFIPSDHTNIVVQFPI